MSIIFVIGPSWNNLSTLLETIEINKKMVSNILTENIKFYLPTNNREVENYFKNLNDNNIVSYYFGENQGHQLSCYNSIISGMKMVINNEELLYNEDIVIFSHEDCYINNLSLLNQAIFKLKCGYDMVCRKYNGTIVGNPEYYMNDTFLINKNIIKNIFEKENNINFIDHGYFCERYFTELFQNYNVYSIPYTHATWDDTELGFYHIPSNQDYISSYWDKKNIDIIYNNTNTNLLTSIGLKYNTDKAGFHLFTDFYETYFKKYLNKNINILEIGIYKGSSLKMLGEYFPKANIYAIDINNDFVTKLYCPNVTTYLCSQIDFDRLNELFSNIKFDIIIDDGSHIISHQQKSLGFLFPFLNKNGLYVCEDLHTSYDPNYIDSEVTTLQILEDYIDTKKIHSKLLNLEENQYLNDNIKEVDIYYRNKNALVCYNCNKLNFINVTLCTCGIDLSSNCKSITSIIIKNEHDDSK